MIIFWGEDWAGRSIWHVWGRR